MNEGGQGTTNHTRWQGGSAGGCLLGIRIDYEINCFVHISNAIRRRKYGMFS